MLIASSEQDGEIGSYDEYCTENGRKVDLSKLGKEFIDDEHFKAYHKDGVLPCHDVFIKYQEGILLVRRDNYPAKGSVWPIGGLIKKGMPTENSLRKKVYSECQLFLENIKLLGVERTFFNTDPFGHGKGTDSINLVYVAEGKGEVKLDDLHSKPKIITHNKYLSIREKLEPYVREYMDFLWSNGNPTYDPKKICMKEWGIKK